MSSQPQPATLKKKRGFDEPRFVARFVAVGWTLLAFGTLFVTPTAAQSPPTAAPAPSSAPATTTESSPATEPAERAYAEGKLSAADFQAKPPVEREVEDGIPLEAKVYTRVRYRYRYKSFTTTTRVKLTLTEFAAEAAVDRTQSYLRQPQNRALIDHEQGHFDITQHAALSAQAAVDKEMQRRDIVAEGKTLGDAEKQLVAKIERLMSPAVEANDREQVEYDHLTKHGTLAGPQAAARQQQLERLAKWAKVEE